MELLLTEAITVLCKNVLTYQSGSTVKGLLGVTVDVPVWSDGQGSAGGHCGPSTRLPHQP